MCSRSWNTYPVNDISGSSKKSTSPGRNVMIISSTFAWLCATSAKNGVNWQHAILTDSGETLKVIIFTLNRDVLGASDATGVVAEDGAGVSFVELASMRHPKPFGKMWCDQQTNTVGHIKRSRAK
eukprot:Opistho-2@26794